MTGIVVDKCLQLIDKMDNVFCAALTADNELWVVSRCKFRKLIKHMSHRCMMTVFTAEGFKEYLKNYNLLHVTSESPLGHFKIKTFSDEGVKTAKCSDPETIYQEVISCLLKVIFYGRDRVMVRSTFRNEVMGEYFQVASLCTIKSHAPKFGLKPKDLIKSNDGNIMEKIKLTSDSDELIFDYVNYRGEQAERRVCPPFNIFFGSTEFHKEDQWMLEAWDIEKSSPRIFAMKDIKAFR